MVPQARLIDLRHGDAASPGLGVPQSIFLPPQGRWLWKSASIRGTGFWSSVSPGHVLAL